MKNEKTSMVLLKYFDEKWVNNYMKTVLFDFFMKLKIFKNLFIYSLLFTPLSLVTISCSGNNSSNAKFKEEITADIIPPITAVAALGQLSPAGEIRQLAAPITQFGSSPRVVEILVNEGDFVSFIGPSGCGKTTLLRVIAALETPTEGKVTVNNMTPNEARKARQYGYVFQAAGLYPWRTVSGNIKLPLEIMGYSTSEKENRTRK